MFQGETVAHVRTRIVAVEISDHTRLHFDLDITCRLHLLVSDILILEVDTGNIGRRNNVRTQYETGNRNDPRRNSIRQHQPPETHSAGKHRNDLRVVSQLGGKENNRNEREQRTEQVGKIRNKVHVIVQDDCLQRHIRLQELIDLFVYVENYRDRDNQDDRENIRSEKLLDDIPVYPF